MPVLPPLASADLEGVAIVPKPADWRSRETAERLFRRAWCDRAGAPPDVCGLHEPKTESERRVLAHRREAWCRATRPDLVPPAPGPTEGTETAPAPDAPSACAEMFRVWRRDFAKAWEAERRAYLEALPYVDLRHRDLRRARMERAFLAGADMVWARLDGADLSNAVLEGADLSDADLKDADLWWATLAGADLSSTDFDGARLQRATLADTNLITAGLDGATLERADLTHALAILASLDGANLTDARLDHATLTGASFVGADLTNATFWFARAEDADFSGAKGLTQRQPATVVGNNATRLPADAKTGEPLHVWSCWSRSAVTDHVHAPPSPKRYLCPPGTDPEPVGTYVPAE